MAPPSYREKPWGWRIPGCGSAACAPKHAAPTPSRRNNGNTTSLALFFGPGTAQSSMRGVQALCGDCECVHHAEAGGGVPLLLLPSCISARSRVLRKYGCLSCIPATFQQQESQPSSLILPRARPTLNEGLKSSRRPYSSRPRTKVPLILFSVTGGARRTAASAPNACRSQQASSPPR